MNVFEEEKVHRGVQITRALVDYGELAPVPEVYQKYSSYPSNQDQEAIFGNAEEYLTNSRTDGKLFAFALQKDCNQITCVATNGAEDCGLVLKLFACQGLHAPCQQDTPLVEFTKIFGSAQLFVELQAELQSFIDKPLDDVVPGIRRTPSTLGIQDAEEAKEAGPSSEEHIDDVLTRAVSGYVDVKRDALGALAYLNASDLTSRGEQISMMLKTILETCPDERTVRCAALCLEKFSGASWLDGVDFQVSPAPAQTDDLCSGLLRQLTTKHLQNARIVQPEPLNTMLA